jgi:hypothetical protein
VLQAAFFLGSLAVGQIAVYERCARIVHETSLPLLAAGVIRLRKSDISLEMPLTAGCPWYPGQERRRLAVYMTGSEWNNHPKE